MTEAPAASTDPEVPAPDALRGTELGDQLDGLIAAVDAGSGRLDPALLKEARSVIERAEGRLRLSSDHTVVAIAGATGSGKSSTFNALTGLELSAVGVRRPTTSWATACVWGSAGARELLEWLGIPDRHQTTRDSMLDTRREGHDMDGVVLLDLPDHDSTEVAHHLEVDRLVALADMMVWVVDPQKYADAAIHDRYLQPLQQHADVMVVVLNHIDEVPEEQRESMLADLRRLLDNDGLEQVPVFPVSARLGWGIPELKDEIARRVADKKGAKERLAADVGSVAGRLKDASGEPPAQMLEASRVAQMDDAIAEAAAVPEIAAAVRRSRKVKAELPEDVKVEHGRVDAEVRSLADDASKGLGAPWQESIRKVAVGAVPPLQERLDDVIASTGSSVSRLPAGAVVARILPLIFAVIAIAAAIWSAVLGINGTLHDDTYVRPSWASGELPQPYPLLICAAAVVLTIVFGLIAFIVVSRATKARAARAEQNLRDAVKTVTLELVVTPIEAELIAAKRVGDGLAQALK